MKYFKYLYFIIFLAFYACDKGTDQKAGLPTVSFTVSQRIDTQTPNKTAGLKSTVAEEKQSKTIKLNDGLVMVADLEPIQSPVINKQATLGPGESYLDPGVVYGIIVYDDSGNLVTVGGEPVTYFTVGGTNNQIEGLSEGMEYTFVCFSLNGTSEAALENLFSSMVGQPSTTLSGLKFKVVDSHFLYQSIKRTLTSGDNKLSIVLANQMTQVTTIIDGSPVNAVISDISTGANTAYLYESYSQVQLSVSSSGDIIVPPAPPTGSWASPVNRALSGWIYDATAYTATSAPALLMTPEINHLSIHIPSIKIGTVTVNNVTAGTYTVAPGRRYVLRVRIMELPIAIPSICTEPTTYHYETIANGLWSSNSTWKNGQVPTGSNKNILITHTVNYNSSDMKPPAGTTIVIKNGGHLMTGDQIQTDNGNTRFILKNGNITVATQFQVTTSSSSVCASSNSCIKVNSGNFQFEESGTQMFFHNSGIRVSSNLQSKANVTGALIRIRAGSLERNGGTWAGSSISAWYAGSTTGFSGLPTRSPSTFDPCATM